MDTQEFYGCVRCQSLLLYNNCSCPSWSLPAHSSCCILCSAAGRAMQLTKAGIAQVQQCSRPSVARCIRVQRPFTSLPCPPASAAAAAAAPHDMKLRSQRMICRAEAVEQTPVTLPRTGFFISKTEVPAFIPRDDMMDQLVRWALIEAEEGGQRNFGLPMKVHQRFRDGMMWGMDIEIIKEGVKVADLSVGFDDDVTVKSEWIGQDENGFPTKEGKQEEVPGKHFEIWKTCDRPVDDDLRAAIRAFCTGLVAALNKYYAFGSVFAEEV